ncbi:reticulon-like protein B12 [Lotus japonicus]|uniref:reticulon-like protein B12 n=1 Tax=Lotus japonicus TaxID=34305 RepID=UPI0025901818|nr:reticulon-like protein B12 [Lotus japonicus]
MKSLSISPADVLLWKNKKVFAGALGRATATAVWLFFEFLEYHLLTPVCHILILSITLLFLWSNAHTLLHKGCQIFAFMMILIAISTEKLRQHVFMPKILERRLCGSIMSMDLPKGCIFSPFPAWEGTQMMTKGR